MSITKSYNKHTDTYYAYETTYEWDEKCQKKVQKKTCIGKYDPVTGEIIPNAKRGRPSKHESAPRTVSRHMNDDTAFPVVPEQFILEMEEIVSEMTAIRSEVILLSEKFLLLEKKLHSLKKAVASDYN